MDWIKGSVKFTEGYRLQEIAEEVWRVQWLKCGNDTQVKETSQSITVCHNLFIFLVKNFLIEVSISIKYK